MALTLEQIDSYLATLHEANGSGTLKVRFSDGREVQYRTGAELIEGIRYYEAEKVKLQTVAAGRTRPVAGFGMFRRT
jgi:hypothetical protein